MAHDIHPQAPSGAPTLEEIARQQFSPEGVLARELLELRQRIEALEHYAGSGPDLNP